MSNEKMETLVKKYVKESCLTDKEDIKMSMEVLAMFELVTKIDPMENSHEFMEILAHIKNCTTPTDCDEGDFNRASLFLSKEVIGNKADYLTNLYFLSLKIKERNNRMSNMEEPIKFFTEMYNSLENKNFLFKTFIFENLVYMNNLDQYKENIPHMVEIELKKLNESSYALATAFKTISILKDNESNRNRFLLTLVD